MQQQPNFTLLDLVMNEPYSHEKNKVSIKEPTAKFVTYNDLGLSLFLEANCTSNIIDKQIFSQLLKMIEDKLSEFEQRLDNRDQIKNIEQQLLQPDHYFRSKMAEDTQSDMGKQRKFSQQSDAEIVSPQTAQVLDQKSQKSIKSQRSKSQLGKANTELSESKPRLSENTVIQKLEQYDKKIHSLTEQITKLTTKEDQFQRKIEQQISQQLKETQDRLIQNDKLFKQTTQTTQDIVENHRGFLNHMTTMKQEIRYQEFNQVIFSKNCKKSRKKTNYHQ